MLPSLIVGALAPAAAHGAAAAAGPGGADPATGFDPAVLFDPTLFPGGGETQVDLSRFEKPGYVAPGTYRGDITVNQVWRAREDFEFVAGAGDNSQLCYDAASLSRYGIDLAKLSADPAHAPRKVMPHGKFCGDISDYVPGATASFDGGEQSLSLSVPQIYMSRDARGYVDPSQWDAGINADVLGYDVNLYRSGPNARQYANGYIGLNNSLSLESWHFNHTGSLGWTQGRAARYQNTATYLQHDIPAWQAQFVAGETFTPGDLFDSVRIRGVRMYADDRMLPQSMRGYAPVVRGVAETNAHVVIRQNGYIIYDTTVAPGPFVIDDLFPTGYGGDLDIEITEADGRVRHLTQVYSAVPQLLRPGQQLWSVTAGRVEQTGMRNLPIIGQATYQRGLNNWVTSYGGATAGAGYQSVLVGNAFNTPIGALSADVTYAGNRAPGVAATSGYGLRLGYNENFTSTGTNLGIAAYRYATPGFVGLSDAMVLRDAAARGQANLVLRQHTRMDITVAQSLGDNWGQLYLNASWRNYWNGGGRQVDFNAGYSNHWKSLTYSISATRTRDNLSPRLPGQAALGQMLPVQDGGYFTSDTANTVRDTRLMLTFTLPLGRTDSAPLLSTVINRSRLGGNSNQTSISGSLRADKRFTYNASIGRSGGAMQGSLSGAYMGTRGNINGSYSQGASYRQMGFGGSGALVAHAGGVTFSQPTGSTIGLIDAPGATGAQSSNAAVDGRGYAVVANLMPYQLNTIELDPKGAAANVELQSSTQSVAPRAGSVVRLQYKVDSSQLLLIDATKPDGGPLPFGADVLNEKGDTVGVVGQASRLVVRGVEASTILTVRWGANANESCHLSVDIPSKAKGARSGTQMLQSTCGATASIGSMVTQPLTDVSAHDARP
ncbi:fimbria/pilus outer membrane usher protein [Dyella monticola]|uniref:fimbria/pilus outer membrane usher protein n=1 Tax=Dyella monticola TaxID=1927958 RepID=UPI0013143772|nr:fimbria/pilus outer membrane usher protein [Dyella monticola]